MWRVVVSGVEMGEVENGNPARTKSAIIKVKILERRAKVAELLLKGYTKLQTARELGVSERTVENDRSSFKKELRESTLWTYGEYVEIERQRLEMIGREALDAWERPDEEITVKTDVNGKLIDRTIKDKGRDGRFLETAIRASESRRKLLGLDSTPAPPASQPPMPTVNVQINQNADPIYLPAEQRRDIVISLMGHAPDPLVSPAETTVVGPIKNPAGNGNVAGSDATDAGKVLPTPPLAKANGHARPDSH